MIRILLLVYLSIMLSACDGPTYHFTPIENFQEFVLDGMDSSVANHLTNLSDSIQRNSAKGVKLRYSGWLKLAHALHGYEILDEAEMAYQNALSLNHKHPSVYYQLAHLYKLQSNYQLSDEYFKRAIDQDSDYAPAYNNLANNLYDQGLFLEAKETVLKSLALNKNDVYALQILAKISSQLNEDELAIKALEDALSLQPKASKLYLSLAQLYQKKGQITKADEARKKSGSGALAISDPWLMEVTNSLQGYSQFITKSQRYLDKKDYQTALKWAKKASSDRPEGFNAHMLLGLIEIRLGQLDQGVKHFLKARQQRPKDFRVNLNLGIVYKENGKYKNAINYLSQALKVNSSHTGTKINLADALCFDRQYQKSMQIIEELKSSSQGQEALFIGLRCQIINKRYRMAYQLVNDNIETNLNNDAFVEFAVLLLATTPINEHRDGDRALFWLDKLIKKQPTNKRNQLLIMALMTVNRFAEAQQLFNQLQPTKDLYLSKTVLQQLLQQKKPYIMSEY